MCSMLHQPELMEMESYISQKRGLYNDQDLVIIISINDEVVVVDSTRCI